MKNSKQTFVPDAFELIIDCSYRSSLQKR